MIIRSSSNAGIEIDAKLAETMRLMGVPIPSGARIVDHSDYGDARGLGGRGTAGKTEPSQRRAHPRAARHAAVLAPPMVPSTSREDGVCGADTERNWPSAADMGGHGRTRA